jgi:hypothetical protein
MPSTKDNTHIFSNPPAFFAALARARALFLTFDGVVSVGFGQKQTAGQYKDDLAIVVYVREKKKEEAIAPAERIPPEFEGYATDVRVVREAHPHKCDNDTSYDTITGGIQISTKADKNTGQFDQGSLGCIVRKRNDSGRENVYLLSNKHVLFHIGRSGPGDYVYHPYPPVPSGFASPGPSAALGPIQLAAFFGNEPIVVPDAANPGQFILQNYFIDCAIARLDLDSVCCGSTCTKDATKYATSVIDLQVNGVNTIVDVFDASYGPNALAIIGRKVFKVGRTTGRTVGIVRLTTASAKAPAAPELGTPAFVAENVLEIDFDVSSDPTGLNCKGHAWFSEKGDSGSLVVDEQGRAVGLVSLGPAAGSPTVSPDNPCHIVPILDRLGICIGTTSGTSHGSSNASDATGQAPVAVPPAQSALPVGSIGFTSQQDEAMLGLTAPRPVTDEEARHMRELLAEFRETRLGPELHAVFAEVRREIGYLIRNARPVKVAWHRHKGPAFLAHVLNHVAGETDRVPHAIDGVTRRALLVRMREVLAAHGSNPLRQALARHGDEIIAMLTRPDCDSVADCLDYLREKEPA